MVSFALLCRLVNEADAEEELNDLKRGTLFGLMFMTDFHKVRGFRIRSFHAIALAKTGSGSDDHLLSTRTLLLRRSLHFG